MAYFFWYIHIVFGYIIRSKEAIIYILYIYYYPKMI